MAEYLLEVAGSPAERGRRHGRELAVQIAQLYEAWIAGAARKTPPVQERDLLAYVMAHLPESRAYAPDLVEEVDGIAGGAGLPFEKVWLLNCFDEATSYTLYRQLNAGHACTTFTATGASTTDGATYVGQTWDGHPWEDSVIMRIAAGGGEIGALVYTHPGIVGGSGINAAGLALVWNSLTALDARSGVPCTFLVRKTLQQPKLSDALLAATGGVRAIGFNFIIAAGYGAFNIEASATRQHVRYVGRHLGHANHFEEPEMLQFEGAGPSVGSATTYVRGGRINQLLDQVEGRIDLEACQQMLRDHANYPGSICRHEDPGRSDYYTRAALLYAPAQGRMLVTDGPACQNPFREYRIELSAVPRPN